MLIMRVNSSFITNQKCVTFRMYKNRTVMYYVLFYSLTVATLVLSRNDPKNDPRNSSDLTLWIDEKQVKMFSGKHSTICSNQLSNLESNQIHFS